MIGIIGFNNLEFIPYLKRYTDILEKANHKFEIIYWDRNNKVTEQNDLHFVYQYKVMKDGFKIKKFIPMILFTRYAINVIHRRKYDFLIILTTIPSVLMSRFLAKNYKNRYIVDIRDYTYEHITLYKKRLSKAISNSSCAIISSPEYINFLPDYNYLISHNSGVFNYGNKTIRSEQERIRDVLRVSYIGMISYYEEVVKFINCIKNDNRFLFTCYGTGDSELLLKEYCKLNNINNVEFKGEYSPSEKEGFYALTDIIYNGYGNNNKIVKFALSNKFYEALWYRIPILVSPNTTMANLSESISFELDFKNGNLADDLHYWYNNISWYKFENLAINKIDTIIDQDNMTNIRIFNILSTIPK